MHDIDRFNVCEGENTSTLNTRCVTAIRERNGLRCSIALQNALANGILRAAQQYQPLNSLHALCVCRVSNSSVACPYVTSSSSSFICS